MALFSKKSGKSSRDKVYCTAVITAAGTSQRMDGEDKLFIEICGAPVLAHSLLAFQNCPCINEIIIAAREDKIGVVGSICEQYGIDKAVKIMLGGPTRLESVLNCVLAVSKRTQLIAIHDGARPCVSADIIENTVHAAIDFHAAAPGVPVSSTLKRVKNGIIIETVGREDLAEIQTPQVFAADLIKGALTNALHRAGDITDDCLAAELIGVPVHVTEGSRKNIKLTTAEDIMIAESILTENRGGLLSGNNRGCGGH